MSFKSFSLAALALAGALGVAGAASAMPVSPVHSESSVEQARFGCGPGMRPGAYGRCAPVRRAAPPAWGHRHHHRGYGYGPRHHRGYGHGPSWERRY